MNGSTRPSLEGRARRARWAAFVIVALVASLAIFATPVAAASQTKSANVSLAGGTDPGVTYNVTGTCDECVPDLMGQLVTGHGSWSFAFGAAVHTVVAHIHPDHTAFAVAVDW